jgi:glycosyltransferase involved in cell wall biosynthesis
MSRPIRILELRSVRGTGGGPEKTILMGAAMTDPARFAVSVCYIRDRRDDAFGVTARASGTAIDYREIEERHSFDPSVWTALRAVIRDRRPDIVHAHDYKTNLLAWMLWHATGVAPLSTVHGWTGHSRRERLFYYPCDKRVLARYPRLVAVSSDIKNELVRHGARPARVTTILNGIDHRAFRRDPANEASARAALNLDPRAIVIGAVGRLEPQKRFDLLIDAVAALRPDFPQMRLVIVGDGSLRDALASHAAARNATDYCVFTGHTHDIAGIHHAFDLFVQSSDYEGTPNAVLEAMALESPIVATDVGGTAELVIDGLHGVIVPPGDAQVLARAMRRALADPDRARRMAAAARLRIERELSFDARMQRLEAIYEEMVETGPLSPVLAGSYT